MFGGILGKKTRWTKLKIFSHVLATMASVQAWPAWGEESNQKADLERKISDLRRDLSDCISTLSTQSGVNIRGQCNPSQIQAKLSQAEADLAKLKAGTTATASSATAGGSPTSITPPNSTLSPRDKGQQEAYKGIDAIRARRGSSGGASGDPNNSDTFRDSTYRYEGKEAGKAQYDDEFSGKVKENLRAKRAKNTPCRNSDAMGEYTNCSTTESWVSAQEISNITGQIGGQIATQIAGQKSIESAMKDGSQVTALKGAAKTAKTAGQLQMSLGAVNATMATVLYTRKAGHDNDGATIEREVEEGKYTTDGAKIQGGSTAVDKIDEKLMGGQRSKIQSEMDANTSAAAVAPGGSEYAKAQNRALVESYAEEVDKVGSEAANEQKGMANKAKTGMVASMLTAVQNFMSGAGSLMAARQAKKAAQELEKNKDGYSPKFESDPFPDNPNNRTTTTVTGEEAAGDPQSADQAPEKDGLGDLGPGFRTNNNENINPGAPPGAFKPAEPGEGGGGGSGSAGLGSNSTSPASEEAKTDPQAKYANLGGGAGKYDSQGGRAAGGRGGGGSGNGGGMGDLAGLMKQMMGLGAKDDEAAAKGKSQFSYGRGPSTQDSLLGRDVNIWQRISTAYGAKAKSGEVK